MSAESESLPVTFLSGFLGSGKTTLVNRILSENHGQNIAVIVNEFGDVGIDGRLVVGVDDSVVELSNGCICCSVRGDLRDTLLDLLKRRTRRFLRRKPFDRVLIEASGLASPGPAVQTLLIEPILTEAYAPAGIVTLVHTQHIVRQLRDHPEASEQVAYADLLILNHLDHCDESTIDEAETQLAACNQSARRIRTTHAEVQVEDVLGIRSIDSKQTFANAEARRTPTDDPCGVDSPHTCGVGTVALETDVPLNIHQLKMWLQFLCKRKGQDLMRLKGVLRCDEYAGEVVVQGIYQWLQLGPGEGEPPEVSQLILIGRHLDREEIERGFQACLSQ